MIDEKLIKDIVWWIPFKKIRNLVRDLLLHVINSNNRLIEMDNRLNNIEDKIENMQHQMYILNRTKNKNIIYISVKNWFQKDINSLENFTFYKLFEQILKKYNKIAAYNTYRPDIEIFSVFGPVENIKKSIAKVKIFYTGESVNPRFMDYSNNCLDTVNLSIGFNHLKNNHYIRIPYWFLAHFNNELLSLNKTNIRKTVKNINNSKYNKEKFCTLIANWDNNSTRKQIYKKLSKIDKINCPSQLFHNDDDLKNIFNDNKIEYLKQFKFNICPENSMENGYVTEKLFDAFCAGCIPIWWGDENIEPDVINKNAVLYWKKDEDNETLIKEIEKLNKDDKLYESFMLQPKLHDKASDYIYGQITSLHEKIEDIIKTNIL